MEIQPALERRTFRRHLRRIASCGWLRDGEIEIAHRSRVRHADEAGEGSETRDRARPWLHLMVGLPGAGKTTLARRIAAEQTILRLTPDEWMAPLFGDNDAGGRRDILEGRMVWVAHQVLGSGASVILDFGCWSPEERWAIRAVADCVGAGFGLHYLEVDEQERRARAAARWPAEAETTFPMSEADHDRFLRSFCPPSAAELVYEPAPEPPAGFESWLHWASHRWPTLPRLDREVGASGTG